MCTILRNCGHLHLLAIVLTVAVEAAEMRQVAADDAGTNAPASSGDKDSQWPTPPAGDDAASEWQSEVEQLYDQIAREQSSRVVAALAGTSLLVLSTVAGFALIEIGLSRSKNNRGCWLRNFLICPFVGLAFWGYGFALGWGNWFNGPVAPDWFAKLGPGLTSLDRGLGVGADPAQPGMFRYGLLGMEGFCLREVDDPAVTAIFLLMLGCMITAALVPVGAIAERWRWKNFLLYGLWVALPYSIYANWVWGGGWLAQSGMNWGLGHGAVDFAGSGVVYGMGGVIALAASIVLGPRVRNRTDTRHSLPGRDLLSVLIGTMVLLPVFAVRMGSEIAPLAANTMLSMFTGALGATLLLKLRRMSSDAAMICKGLLAGSVAIAGSCPFVDSFGAAIIGATAGMLCVPALWFCDRMGVDDVIGAVSVFGVSGIWGVVALGLFAAGRSGDGWNGVARPQFVESYGSDGVRGLLYGDPSQFVAQLLAAGVLIVFGFITALAWFRLSNRMTPMRATTDVG